MARTYKPLPKTKRPAKPLLKTLTIDHLDAHGKGVVRHKPVVFVQGALPAEVCEVEITNRKKRFWEGTVARVQQASEQRVVPFCPHFARCGGCQTQHAAQAAMGQWKQEAISAQLKRAVALEHIPWYARIEKQDRGYRRRARLAVDARNPQKVKLGFRSATTNAVLAIEQCGILMPELQALLLPLQMCLQQLDNPRAVGHAILFAADNGRQLTLRVTRTLGADDTARLYDFAEQQDVQVLLDQGDDNVRVMGDPAPKVYAPEAGLALHVQPDDFVQVNHEVNQAMVAQAMQWLELDPRDRVLDLFCGLGNFSLPLARRTERVLGIEGSTKMVQRAAQNARRNGIDNVEFVAADLRESATMALLARFDGNKLLLDPARDGALAVMPQIRDMELERIVYVSCNPVTFVRDCTVLLEQNYQLAKISLMDMFPQTAHTELMALFVRQV